MTLSVSPDIEVGILFSNVIHFQLNGNYVCLSNHKIYQGDYTLMKKEKTYLLQSATEEEEIDLPVSFTPQDYESSDFGLTEVTIGINFHWERKENQKFKGTLKIIDEGEHLSAINILPLEDYLISVISSEMSATSSIRLLKAHAIISRSWLLAQKEKSGHSHSYVPSCPTSENENIRWWDREDHAHFDVCADDHCQRYQGITRATTPQVETAVKTTRGEVLVYENSICDARFSKCCGGVTENFENVWEPISYPYLRSIADNAHNRFPSPLKKEENARAWILTNPSAFCNTDDPKILNSVLNDYDRETVRFFRWKVTYTTQELTALVSKQTGIRFGEITDLIPIERGSSGRIIRLKICGTLRTVIIGKELAIRKALSETHLYSSAFVIKRHENQWTLYGAGWGHGVGLCQIGAAVMAEKGYDYREILSHYYPQAKIKKIYE